ncbi:magnesium transporter [Thermaurantiacus sp.]
METRAALAPAMLEALLRAGDREGVAALLQPLPPADIADALAELAPEEAGAALEALAPAVAARVLGYLPAPDQLALAEAMPRTRLQRLFADMPHDERADLWKGLPEETREALLPGLAAAEREDVRRLASYAEGTAGSIMTSDYAVLPPDVTAAEAIALLRREAPDRETIYDAYVIDSDRRLVGVVSLRDLLLAPETRRIADLMVTDLVFARVDDKREAVADKIADYDLLAIPVIDEADRLVGIVTFDDALDVAEAALARRLTDFGGTAALGGPDIDIIATPVPAMFRARFIWLALLTGFGMISSLFVAAQEALLSKAIVLAAFIAPIIDMGGNTGSQSATLVIRAMALGQISSVWRDVVQVLRRDVPVAAALGIGVAALEVLLALIFKEGIGTDVLWVVGLSMLIVTIAGSLFGVTIPFIARALRIDPATLSAPLITSIMDLLGVIIYFSIAWAFLADMLAGSAR